MTTTPRVGRDPASALSDTAADLIGREKAFGARNYDPLPVVLTRGEGSWLIDVDGRRYLDLMSAYSAVSFGHAHPRIVGALVAQAQQLGVTSRAYLNDELPSLFERARAAHRPRPRAAGERRRRSGRDGAQGGAQVGPQGQGRLPTGRAEIIACRGNFHGRTITATGLSTEPQYRDGFGPFPPGLSTIPYGDADALAQAITPRTAAFLVEPIQGEGGIIVPPRRLSRALRADLPRASRAADLRRDPDRARTHRQVPRVRARRRQARRRHPRQGARRRTAAGVGVRRDERRDAGVPPGRPRQHVRRQSARGGGCDGRARRAGGREPDRARGGARRVAACPSCRTCAASRARRARPRLVRRHRGRRAVT